MNTRSTTERWVLCKAMSVVTGVPSPVFFKHFVALSEEIVNTALTQPNNTQDPTAANALRDHVNALNGGEPTPPPPAQPLPSAADTDPSPVPDKAVQEYTQRLRLALWFIVQCGGVEQATFVLQQACKAYPADTSPAFARPTK